ncbi:MAG TPA: PKD domain-containing protein [Verrucomicrobiae bacterium]|nr:PKD domain-containing protein [Verrucomicrobiae bacterium]
MRARVQPVVVLFLLSAGLSGSLNAAANTLLGWSETGLHEIDGGDFSVFSISPPYNTIHAQLIVGGLLVTNPAGITVTYQAIADASGSINTTSQGKGNFYKYAPALFGKAVGPDQGLSGFGMPGANNTPQAMVFDPAQKWFSAQGIPITPYDDAGHKNYYPMMRLTARDSGNNVLATTDIALPVSDEMHCATCHASGSQAAARPPKGWVWNVDPAKDYKLNILRSHDDYFLGTAVFSTALAQVGYSSEGLYASATKYGQPVLCVKCHASNALPGTGATNVFPLTQLMHAKHSFSFDPASGQALSDMTNSAACLLCHTGPENRRVRGVHHNPVNPNGTLGLQCQSCHGTITALGATGRQGWLDEPLCQSCHTGTATQNKGSLRFTTAFETNGLPRQAADLTFATVMNTPSNGLSLFHLSYEHGGLKCSACHGPSHAEVTSYQANDNVQSAALKTPAGAGVLTECTACHLSTFTTRTNGPHGMHPVDAMWAASHDHGSRSQCQACHGADYRGTALSWAQGSRSYNGDTSVSFWHGFQIGCYSCHNGPNGTDGGMANPFPTVSNASASTTAGVPVPVTLAGSAFNGGAVTFRLVTQPAHGLVALNNNIATYYPDPTFVGNDSFTYTVWDNAANSSSVGTVALTSTSGQCVLSASVLAPTAAFPNSPVPFTALATLSQCSSSISYDWDFGDGTAHGSGTNVSHVYPKASNYNWTLKVSAGATSQTVTGLVTISPTLGPPLMLTLTPQAWSMNLTWPVDNVPSILETTGDWTQPYAWQPDIDPVSSDGYTNTVQVYVLPGPQYYRLRRVP